MQFATLRTPELTDCLPGFTFSLTNAPAIRLDHGKICNLAANQEIGGSHVLLSSLMARSVAPFDELRMRAARLEPWAKEHKRSACARARSFETPSLSRGLLRDEGEERLSLAPALTPRRR